MGTSPLSPRDIHAAAGAHHELGPEYSDAVVASFLEKVDREIAARVDERLATSPSRPRPVATGNRRAALKGFAAGVAASIIVVLLAESARPGHHAFILLPILAVLLGAGVFWARRHLTFHRVPPRQAPGADGDRRWA